MKLLRLVVLLLFVAPAAAEAAPATVVSRDLPLRAERALASSAPTFTMVGLHWQGPGEVRFRTRSVAGRWSRWRPAAPETEDRPDPGAAERSVPGWRIGNPYWTGLSDAIQVRTRGLVTRVRAHYVRSRAGAAPRRTLSLAGSPAIVTRPSWGANESIRRASPLVASAVRLAVVHHTAGTNSYSRAQSAAIVRGILAYHVQGNGWNDLGYNFLVDKYGQVFEGRYGGVDRNVVGAHAEGFNTGSVGVAVIGTYSGAGITPAARAALVQLLAWRLDVAHVDAASLVSVGSGGNSRFPRGIPVSLRAVSGHRDTGFTSCPGDRLYAQLDSLAAEVAQTGLPKLYAPAARGGPGAPVRFTARLTLSLPWTVRVADAAGNAIASGSGLGTAVDWTWDATAAPPGAYSWSIEAPDVLPATGTLGAATSLSLGLVRAEPAVVSPNGDGHADRGALRFVLGAPATVTATAVDGAGAAVGTVFSGPLAAGEQSIVFAPDGLPDGAYRLVLSAVNGSGKQVGGSAGVAVNRTLGGVAAEREAVSPNGDGRLDRIGLGFTLLASAEARVRVLREGKWVATVFSGPLGPGPQRVEWDGTKRIGKPLPGSYEVEVTATNEIGTVVQRAPFVLDTAAPSLRLLSARPLRLRLSEPARVVLWVNGRRRELDLRRAGILWLRGPAVLRTLRAVAYDRAGNVSDPLVRR